MNPPLVTAQAKVGDLLWFGTEEGRSLGLEVVAKSTVYFAVPTDSLFDKAMLDLRAFATTLRLRKQGDVHYGWSRLFADRQRRAFQFEILWYDHDFFLKRQNGYKSTLHQRVLGEFGIAPEDLVVTHHPVQFPISSELESQPKPA